MPTMPSKPPGGAKPAPGGAKPDPRPGKPRLHPLQQAARALVGLCPGAAVRLAPGLVARVQETMAAAVVRGGAKKDNSGEQGQMTRKWAG